MIKKYVIPLFLTGVIYIIYSLFILKASSYTKFSLIDDGELFLQNHDNFVQCLSFDICEKLKAQIVEKEFGRFRPVRWFVNATLFFILGKNPGALHIFKIFVLGSILVALLTYILRREKVSLVITVFCSLLFITNYSFTENIIRLGTDEPYQLLFIIISMLLILSNNINNTIIYLSVIFLTLALFIKETSLAILPGILYLSYKNKIKYIIKIAFVLSGITLVGIALSRSGSLEGVYSDNYQNSIGSIVNSFIWYSLYYFKSLYPFSFAFLIYPFIFKNNNRRLLSTSILIVVFYTIGISPWKYNLERYAFIPIFFLVVIIGLIMSNLISLVFKNINNLYIKTAYNLALILVLSNIFFYGQISNIVKTVNYQMWYSKFIEYESDQVMALSGLNDKKVYINATDSLDNWEVLFEIPIHLKYLYSLDPNYIGNKFNGIPSSSYILENTTLIPQIPKNKYNQIYLTKSYNIPQILPNKFIDNVKMRPIQTLSEIEKYYNYDYYYWKILKI